MALLLRGCSHLSRALATGFEFPYVGWKDRKALAAALRPIYTAINAGAAAVALEALNTVRGDSASLPSQKPGAASGIASFRFSHSRLRCGA
jgi:hypothetical protein